MPAHDRGEAIERVEAQRAHADVRDARADQPHGDDLLDEAPAKTKPSKTPSSKPL